MRLLVRLVARRARPEAVAVALTLIWICVAEVSWVIVAPEGMPEPLTTSPTLSPAMLGTVTMRVLIVVPTEVRLMFTGPRSPFTFSRKTRPLPVRDWLPRELKPPELAFVQPLMTTVWRAPGVRTRLPTSTRTVPPMLT